MIFDRNGKELAVSVPVVSVYADPLAIDKALGKKVLRCAKAGEDYKTLADDKAELAVANNKGMERNPLAGAGECTAFRAQKSKPTTAC